MADVRPHKVTYSFLPKDLIPILAEHLGVPESSVSINWNITELRDAFDRSCGIHDLTSIDVTVR